MMLRKLWIVGIPFVFLGVAAAAYMSGYPVPGLSYLFGEGQLVLEPAHVDFGPVTLGTGAREELVVATNEGTRNLTVRGISADSPFVPDQAVFELRPGDARIISIRLVPKSMGKINGTLTVDTSVGTVRADLSAQAGHPPEITINPVALSFGDVRVNGRSTGELTITNVGDADLELGGSTPGAFSAELASTRLVSGESTKVAVSFEPDEAIKFSSHLEITTNDPKRKRVLVQLDGTGVDRLVQPLGIVSPAGLNFGKVPVGSSDIRWISVDVEGKDALTVTSILVQPPYEAPIQSRTIGPGGSLGFPISFAPESAGQHDSKLVLRSNDPENPEFVVQLQGEGFAGTAEELARSGYVRPGGGDVPRSVLDVIARSRAEADRRNAAGGTDADSAANADEGDGSDPGEPEFPDLCGDCKIVFGGYYADIGDVHVDNTGIDPSTGRFAIEGLHIPDINGAMGAYWEFEPTDAVGRVSAMGEVDGMAMPYSFTDRHGQTRAGTFDLTTGTVTYQVGGTQVPLSGTPFGPDGTGTVVAATKIDGRWLRIKLEINSNAGTATFVGSN